MTGEVMTQYRSFYTGATREFGNFQGGKEWEHHLETEDEIKALQVANVRCNLSPIVGGLRYFWSRLVGFLKMVSEFIRV